MAAFKEITTEHGLPREQEAYERAILDLKTKYDLAQAGCHCEMAKDAAAFANHLGGCILVGVRGDRGIAARYEPLSDAEANDQKREIEHAVRDRCSPHPTVEVVPISTRGGFVLAVNVAPSMALIGVKVRSHRRPRADEPRELSPETGEATFLFPLRTTTHTTFLEPDQLPMYMLPEVRRIVLLLSRIKPDTPINLFVPGERPAQRGYFEGFDEQANVVRITATNEQGARTHTYNYPLDRVMTAHAANRESDWSIYLKPYD